MPFSDFILRQKLLAQGVNPSSGAGGPSTPGGMPASPGLLSRLFPVADAAGLVTPEQQRAAQQQGLLGFGTSLLANSGPQPGPRQGLGALLGQALQAGQGAAGGSINNQLQAMLLQSKIQEAKNGGQDPAKVREYQFAKQNGFTGTYQEFLQIGQGGIGNFNPGDYTPESFAKFQQTGKTADLQRYVAPSQPSVQVVNGVPTMVQGSRTGGATRQDPLSTLGSESAAQQALKAAAAEGSATGAATGEARGAIQKKGIAAAGVQDLLSVAEPLIEVATGSGAGAAADAAAGFFGFAPDSATAAAQLKVIEAGLISAQPRLEGPQGVLDLKLYKEAAASIGDPTVPAASKKAALATIRQIQQRAQQAAGQSSSSPAAGAKTANRPPLSSFRK